MDVLQRPEVGRLLADARHAVVGVNRAQGAPQLSVVWFVWDGEAFRFSTTRGRAKYLNLRRDPSISLLIDDFDNKFYVAAYGTARLVEDGHDELARPLLAKYMPERLDDPGWTPDRVIVELRPDRILVGH
ncbi:PPOX class F420-dependent oxidoreductase [Actinoplanes sp. NBC_00393]|uniref:pyridoxamine 5'-phosphate oxidase family protein n=1 Tax=Actinoplanes sp. NBC_00393 TaxID=2975953 RepID=UPI002E1AA72C